MEILFVIVILGILAAVAVPRFFGIEAHARKNIAKAFAATLTRTVGHSFWSKSMLSGAKGSIKSDSDGNNSLFYGKSLEEYVSIPRYFDASSVDFSHCVQSGKKALPFIKKNSERGGEYNIFCRDGNETTAPLFVISQEDSYTF